MDERSHRSLAVFDYDGTLVHLATNYRALRTRLEKIALSASVSIEGGLLALSLRLERLHETASVARSAINAAELEGLARGADILSGQKLYQRLAAEGYLLAIASHNGRPAIETFFWHRDLKWPDVIFDRQRLRSPKDESKELLKFVRERAPGEVVVVGDTATDERLAKALGGLFIAVEPE